MMCRKRNNEGNSTHGSQTLIIAIHCVIHHVTYPQQNSKNMISATLSTYNLD